MRSGWSRRADVRRSARSRGCVDFARGLDRDATFQREESDSLRL